MTIKFNNVSFSYDTIEVLKEVSFAIQSGEYIGIIGPNGGGKTTALQLMFGFLKPAQGTIEILDQTPEQARIKIGYVPQINSYDKMFPISTLEVVLGGCLSRLKWWGGFPAEDIERAYLLLKEVGLEGLEEHPFGTLSGGQGQKALIVRALLGNPDILLLDEPTANVDPQSEEAIFSYLKGLRGKKTILIVTHNFDAIMNNVERVLCFQYGVSALKPQDVCEHFTLGVYHKIGRRSHD